MENETTCPICNGNRIAKFTRRGAAYARCRSCKCVSRLLTPEEYRDLEVSYDADPSALQTPRDDLRKLIDVESKRALLEPFVRSRKHTRLLDIGCGLGGYLLAGRDLGCDVSGIEPSEGHAALAREAFGLDVRQGYFEHGIFPPSSFDVVVLSHVIEHIFDPDSFLSDVLRVVAPGGDLIIITPNADSLVARLSNRYWTMLKPVDHVRMLSETGFRRFKSVKSHGVTIRQSEYFSEPLTGLLAAARDAMRDLAKPHSSSNLRDAHVESLTPVQTLRRRERRRPLLRALAAASLPLHWFNVLSRRQACLVCVVRKSG